jgi:hypothetical protein
VVWWDIFVPLEDADSLDLHDAGTPTMKQLHGSLGKVARSVVPSLVEQELPYRGSP